MTRRVNVLPHTHWDREWYLPFPVFRMRLVELIDGLLPVLDRDESFTHFQLDGQMAAVDDYLEVRPHERDHLVSLNESGRVSMGPWYTLPDEFLVSGETLVRNLRLGRQRAKEMGGAMEIGYLPDMFGHVAQMPQILAGFGLDHAVVWRGVPAAIQAPAFHWLAPDGTGVRAEVLADGYSNGARLPPDGAGLVDMVDDFVEAYGPRVGDPVLWFYGTDHQIPNPDVVRILAEANGSGSRYDFKLSSLADHLASSPSGGLPTWQGELRSGAGANLLMGVASCRVDVKQAAARAERWLERVAEPLVACWMPPEDWPGDFFDLAWLEVIRNAAHDSICGCSADEVNDAVLHRYAEATRVAEQLADRAMIRALAASGQDAIVVNPTARPRAAMVSLVVDGDVAPPHTQQMSFRPARSRTDTLDRRSATAVVLRAAMEDRRVSRVEITESDDAVTATLVADRAPKQIDSTELRGRLEALAEAQPDGVFHLEVERSTATQEVLLRTEQVPGFAWSGLAPSDLGDHAVRPDGAGLTNGLVTVEVDQGDGTFSINGLAGFGRLVDEGDAGDTYNWSPPGHDILVQRPDDVDVLVSEAGPVRGRIEVVRRYGWPTHVADDHRVGATAVVVTTTIELRAGEDLVRLTISFDNTAEDHRLRLHLPLPERADHSEAECAFGIIRRGLEAEGGPNEVGLATFPSRRFVVAGGLTVAHEGLCEYELVDLDHQEDGSTAGELAITILRSVGVISQGPMPMRALPAGPPTPTPGAQMPGTHRVELVLHLGGRDPYAVADEAFTPLLSARRPRARGFGDPRARHAALTVTGAEVTALRRLSDRRLELRVVNPSDQGSELVVEGRTGEVVDLDGNGTGTRFNGTTHLGAHQILTLTLDDA